MYYRKGVEKSVFKHKKIVGENNKDFQIENGIKKQKIENFN